MASRNEPRRVVLTLAAIRSLTVLEVARACATAGVRLRDSQRVLRALMGGAGSADDDATGAALLYAYALQLERRTDPGLTWEAAQSWALTFDAEAGADPIADAEAEAVVAASLATGLPPDAAGGLTLAEAEEYGRQREAARNA